MKIALLGENYYPTLGGIQEHIYHVARYLLGKGHEVRVLTGMPTVTTWRGPRDEEWVSRMGPARCYKILGSRTTLTFGPRIMANLGRTLEKEAFDLVHVHGPCDFGLPSLLFPLYRGPIVATLHSPMNDSSPMRWLAAPYYRYVLRHRCRAVIAVSEAARSAMGRYARFESRIVPNGVDSAALASGKPIPRFADGAVNVLMLGRLEPRNGPDLMFRALPRLLSRRPDVRLLVAGDGTNGIAEYEAMVPPAARHRVVFLGPVYEERADLYASARLCVIPARSGTFSIIALEALAAGTPVVATPFVKGWDKEPHFRPIRVCPDFLPDTLAENILAALSEDSTARIVAGREIARRFDWSEVGAQVEAVYQQVLAESAADGQPRRRLSA